MRFGFCVVKKFRPVNVVVAQKCQNQSAAFVFLLQKTLLNVFWDQEFLLTIRTVRRTFALGTAEFEGSPTGTILPEAILTTFSSFRTTATLTGFGDFRGSLDFFVSADLLAIA